MWVCECQGYISTQKHDRYIAFAKVDDIYIWDNLSSFKAKGVEELSPMHVYKEMTVTECKTFCCYISQTVVFAYICN